MIPGEHATELARQLIALDTTSDEGRELECARVLGSMLSEAGFDIEYFEFAPGRTSLAAYQGNRTGRPLCLSGHLDTVPLGTRPWKFEALAGHVQDGRLYGRGACDMKAGVAALVTSVLTSPVELKRTPGVLLLLTAGEETGCQGARGMVHSGLDMKGAGAIVVAEPTSNQPLLGHKGALWLKLKIAGLSAHGSMPEEGDNALLKGAYLATHLANYRFPSMPHRHLSKATLNVSKFLSGKSINVVPDYAELSVDIRTTPGMQHDEVLGDISRYVAPHEVTFERLLDLPNVWSDEQDPWIQSVFRLLERLQGRPPQPKGASYFTDACIFAPASDNAPTLILGPGDPTMAHQTDEYCNIAQIHEAVAIYSAIVADWCTGSSQLKQQDNVPTPTLEE